MGAVQLRLWRSLTNHPASSFFSLPSRLSSSSPPFSSFHPSILPNRPDLLPLQPHCLARPLPATSHAFPVPLPSALGGVPARPVNPFPALRDNAFGSSENAAQGVASSGVHCLQQSPGGLEFDFRHIYSRVFTDKRAAISHEGFLESLSQDAILSRASSRLENLPSLEGEFFPYYSFLLGANSSKQSSGDINGSELFQHSHCPLECPNFLPKGFRIEDHIMEADSVKRKRKRKMNKHKHRKLRRRLRKTHKR